jgi:hypothetical protein
MLIHTGKFIKQMLSNEELLIVLRRQITFERDQKVAAIECLAPSVLYLLFFHLSWRQVAMLRGCVPLCVNASLHRALLGVL